MKTVRRLLWQWRTSLACKFSLASFVIITGLCGLIYLAIDSLVTKTVYDQFRHRGVSITSNLATNATALLLTENSNQMQLLLKNTQKSEQEVVYVFIVDTQGQVVSHTFPGGFPGDLKKLHQHSYNQPYQTQLIATERDILLDIGVPILQGSVGGVHLGLSRQATDQKLGSIRQRILFICILASLTAIVLAVFYSRRITRPLTALATGAEKIGQGDFAYRVQIDKKDEIGTVARSFNHMALALEEDIARRIRAEKALKKNEHDLAAEKERLSVTLRSIGDGVITTDIGGNIVLLNKVAETLTGWRNDEAVGRSLEEIFHLRNGQTRERCANPVTEVVASGQIVGLENDTVLIARDGTERNIADSGAPIRDYESRIIGVVLVFRDVTEQLKMEKELMKVKKLESVGVLAGGIAHDFNNILSAILGSISLALLDTDLQGGTKELLVRAEKASLRARDLTQQLLTFARGGEPVKETASLESIIRESANFILRGEKVACSYDIPDDLWLVDIDKGQMSQVVQNLVLNAGHAMAAGGIINITCENVASVEKQAVPYTCAGRLVKIQIQDSGGGMSADVLEQVFDPYFTTKDEGSGLGLAITQSIITKHRGHILAESTPGVGTIFTLYLPASENSVAETAQDAPAAEDRSAGRVKILVMDDDEMVRVVTRKMLLHLGHEVADAEHGEEAITLYSEALKANSSFDLVVMDLTVPGGMGGKEAVREILNLDSDAKVIVSSGYSSDPIMANFKEYGFCAAIVKPYQIAELARAISQTQDVVTFEKLKAPEECTGN